MSIESASQKRKYEGNECSSNKRLCLRKGFKEIAVFELVSRYLSFQDLLNFEAAHRNHSTYTQKRWAELRIEERFNFCWPYTDTEKGHYIQGKVLFTYMAEDKKLPLQKVYLKLEGVMLAYKHSLGAFLWNDLSRQAIIQSNYRNRFCYIRNKKADQKAGTLLCYGLFAIHKKIDPSTISILIEGAIRKGATCASLFAAKYTVDPICLKAWTLLSANYGDYRALEYQITKEPSLIQKYYKEGIRYPPILAGRANLFDVAGKHKRAAIFWDRAIDSYANQVPFQVYWKAGITYFTLKQHKKAEGLFRKCFQMDQQNNSTFFEPEMLLKMGENKYLLKKYEEAECYFQHTKNALENTKKEISLYLFSLIASTKFHLKKYSEAETIQKEITNLCQKTNREIPKKIASQILLTQDALRTYIC